MWVVLFHLCEAMALLHRTWYDYKCQERRTFLHVSDSEDEATIFARQVSDPSFYRGDLMTGFKDAGPPRPEHEQGDFDSGWLRSVKTKGMDANFHRSLADAAIPDTPAVNDHPHGCDQEMPAETLLRGCKPARERNPCKAQRARYRKLVESLIQQIKEDPLGVDVSTLQSGFPLWVAENAWLKAKLTNRLVQEQRRLTTVCS